MGVLHEILSKPKTGNGMVGVESKVDAVDNWDKRVDDDVVPVACVMMLVVPVVVLESNELDSAETRNGTDSTGEAGFNWGRGTTALAGLGGIPN